MTTLELHNLIDDTAFFSFLENFAKVKGNTNIVRYLDLFEEEDLYTAVSNAFDWDTTLEGEDYWRKVASGEKVE